MFRGSRSVTPAQSFRPQMAAGHPPLQLQHRRHAQFNPESYSSRTAASYTRPAPEPLAVRRSHGSHDLIVLIQGNVNSSLAQPSL